MPWSEMTSGDIGELRDFVSQREYKCMNFSSMLKKNYQAADRKKAFFHLTDKTVIHRSGKENSIDFAIMLSGGGQLITAPGIQHDGNVVDIGEGMSCFRNSLEKINTVMGESSSVSAIMKDSFPFRTMEKGKNTYFYHVMVLGINDFIKSRSVPESLVIRTAESRDLARLVPLQKNYEIEEVLPAASMFSSIASRQHLANTLREQITVIAEKGGKAVAKANTNCIGFSHCQIGGVYTLPEYRGCGFSTALVSFLAEKILEKGYNVSLFVKTDNTGAIRVYSKLGFKKTDDFTISYFF